MAQLESLDVWVLAMDLVEEIYRWSDQLPKSEEFGLKSQLRRCAVSVPSNIAEGWGRGLGKSQAQFYRVARGSLMEIKTQLLLGQRLGLTGEPTAQLERVELLGKRLHALIESVERRLGG